ncbi:MAG: prohibitin family protein [Thermoanaerobaculia bacterium]
MLVLGIVLGLVGLGLLIGNPHVGGAFPLRRLGGGLVVVAALLGFVSLVALVPAGNVGVVNVFGVVEPGALAPGLHLVNPFANVVSMSTRTQEIKETMSVPTKEGLSVSLEASVIYHLDAALAADVYKTVGENYAAILVEPQFRSITRGVTAEFEAKALYTGERASLEKTLETQLRAAIGPRGVVLETAPLRKIELPARVSDAIEAKLQADQQAQQMEFVLLKEKQEAERKRVEAQGIQDFQRIVSQGISPQLLEWKGIEATLELARSANAKVVVVGSGEKGLPLILGGN